MTYLSYLESVAIEAGLRRGGGVGGDDYEVEEEDGGDDDVEKQKQKHKHEWEREREREDVAISWFTLDGGGKSTVSLGLCVPFNGNKWHTNTRSLSN